MSASTVIAPPFQRQRDTVLGLCADAERIARRREHGCLADAVADAGAQLERGQCVVAGIGSFCAGKSMTLNALLGDPGVFPVDARIATSVVTTASYAAEERVTVRIEGEDAPRLIRRDEIADYVTEERNPDNERAACVLSVELPNATLRDGMMVVDTPGISSVQRRHTAVTYAFLAKADVALFVLDAHAPMTTDELELLRVARRQCHAIVVAVTKIDAVGDPSAILENTRAKVASLCAEDDPPIPVVPISGRAKLAYLRSRDDEELEVSNFPELERELWGLFQSRRAAMLLLRPLGVLARVVDELLDPLERELEVYGASCEADLERADDALRADTERLDQLRAGDTEWRQLLQRSISDLQREMKWRLRDETAKLRGRLRTALSDPEQLKAPTEIAAGVEGDLALLGTELNHRLGLGLARVAERVQETTGLAINPAAPDTTIAADAAVPSLADITLHEITGLVWLRGSQGLHLGLGAAAMLAVPIPVVGMFIAGAGALWAASQLGKAGMHDQRRRTRQEHAEEIRKHLDPPLDVALHELEYRLDRALEEGQRAVVDQFREALAAEQRRLTESAAALAAARRRTSEQARERATALREPATALRRLREATERAAADALHATAEPAAAPPAASAADAPVASPPEPPVVPAPESRSEPAADIAADPPAEPRAALAAAVDRGAWADVPATAPAPARSPGRPDRGEWAEV